MGVCDVTRRIDRLGVPILSENSGVKRLHVSEGIWRASFTEVDLASSDVSQKDAGCGKP